MSRSRVQELLVSWPGVVEASVEWNGDVLMATLDFEQSAHGFEGLARLTFLNERDEEALLWPRLQGDRVVFQIDGCFDTDRMAQELEEHREQVVFAVAR